MDQDNLKNFIDKAFDNILDVGVNTKGEIRDAVDETLNLLDPGKLREGTLAYKWCKSGSKAVLLSFRLNDMGIIQGGKKVGIVVLLFGGIS